MSDVLVLSQFLRAMGVVFLAQFSIIAGIFFISGQLLPNLLAPLYTLLSTGLARTVAASIIIFPLGNWVMAYAFGRYGPALVSPLMIVMMILVNILFAVFVVGTKPSPWLALAVLLMIIGGVWASLLLLPKS